MRINAVVQVVEYVQAIVTIRRIAHGQRAEGGDLVISTDRRVTYAVAVHSCPASLLIIRRKHPCRSIGAHRVILDEHAGVLVAFYVCNSCVSREIPAGKHTIGNKARVRVVVIHHIDTDAVFIERRFL